MTQNTTHTSGAADLPAIISGALFDFAGFLTTLDKSRAVTFSGAHEAGPAVTLLQEWSTKRGLNLDEADVSGWRSALTAQAISAEPAGAGYAAWPDPEVHDEGGWHITYYTATMMRDFADRTHALRASHGQAPAQAAPAAVAGPSEAVAYLDIGTGGYLDLGTDLADEALSRLPKGRHALVIAGTYGIDGYTAAPTTQTSPTAQGDALDAARYRWLRATTNYVTSNGERIDVRNMPEKWDAAIDAARAAQEGK